MRLKEHTKTFKCQNLHIYPHSSLLPSSPAQKIYPSDLKLDLYDKNNLQIY